MSPDYILCLDGYAVFRDTPTGLELAGIFKKNLLDAIVHEGYFNSGFYFVELSKILCFDELLEKLEVNYE